LLILCAGLIFYLSGIPSFSTGTRGFLARKLGHSFVYGIFTFLLWKSIPWFGNSLFKKILLCALIVSAFAIFDELRQSTVPGRHGNYRGVLFDLLGGCTVLSFFAIRTHIRKTELHHYEK
jgi:VanZ family protein